jgi:hypothetical protein
VTFDQRDAASPFQKTKPSAIATDLFSFRESYMQEKTVLSIEKP